MGIDKEYFMDHIGDLAKIFCEEKDLEWFISEVGLLLEQAGEESNEE